MKPAGAGFPGVNYNDKKVEKGTGELMMMKNFPSFINETSSQEEVRNYLKSVSKNEKVKKPQFHAVISTKFQQHSKEELAKITENFMEEMGYGKQPFIVVFHNDTDNNHIHLISTRVDKQTGKKINDSYERLKAQQSLSNTLEKLYGLKPKEELEKQKKSLEEQVERKMKAFSVKNDIPIGDVRGAFAAANTFSNVLPTNPTIPNTSLLDLIYIHKKNK